MQQIHILFKGFCLLLLGLELVLHHESQRLPGLVWSILVQDVVHVDEDHAYLIHLFVMLHPKKIKHFLSIPLRCSSCLDIVDITPTANIYLSWSCSEGMDKFQKVENGRVVQFLQLLDSI